MNWINWAWIGGGLLGSLVVGLLIGRIVAGIKYPNPDKPHIFTPKQSIIILAGVLIAIALIVFAILYQPKPKNGGEDLLPSGMDGMVDPNGVLPMDDAGLDGGEIEPADEQLDGVEEDQPEESGEENANEPETEDGATDENEDAAKANPVT